MASEGANMDILFKEHSFEEIESVRDNLASEIEKRTDLLKSIVKEKYQDIVETSDTIKSMKLNLNTFEAALRKLDDSTTNYYDSIIEKPIREGVEGQTYTKSKDTEIKTHDQTKYDDTIKKLDRNLCLIWESLDCCNFRYCVKLHSESSKLIEQLRDNVPNNESSELGNIVTMLERSKHMLKNLIYHKVQTCESSQVGIIADCDLDEELYQISLDSVLKFLVTRFRADIFDTSFQSQIKRHQPCSYFNTETNQIESITDEPHLVTKIYVQIPKLISPELELFLYDVCRAVNTIAGFSLNRTFIVYNLSITIENSLEVYSYLLHSVNELKAEFKRRRALQLYFDLLYLRILLNSSNSIELIEKWDPQITELSNKFEVMLDSIELYMISTAIHANVVELSQSRMRLLGLLVPHQHCN